MTDHLTVNGPEAARSLRPVVAEEAARSEHDRTLTERTVAALWDSGLMQWCNPLEAAGSEPTFRDMIETWIELAWQDGSLGWIGIANLPSGAASAAYLPDEGFAEVFVKHDLRVTAGGQFFPNGLAETTGGGYRLTGSVEFRLGDRALPIRRRRVHPDGERRDGGRRGRASALDGGAHPAGGGRVHRRLERAGVEGHRFL